MALYNQPHIIMTASSHFAQGAFCGGHLFQDTMEVVDLAKEWAQDPHVRERVRTEKALYVHPVSQKWCEPTRANCISNAFVLKPLLCRLRDAPEWKLPYLEPLQVEISRLFEDCNVPVDVKMVYRASMECKKLLGFVKRRAVRKEPTKAWSVEHLQEIIDLDH